jgi:predicted MFS family arabinose efflux permease
MAVGEFDHMTADHNRDVLWTRSFTLTLLGIVLLFIPFALYLPVMPVYLLKELHSSMDAAGTVNCVFLIASVLFRSQTARLEARFGSRGVVLGSAFTFMATNVLYLPVTSVVGILLIRFLSGASFAIASNGIYAMGSRLIPKGRKGEGLACMTTMVLAGNAIGPYIGLKLSHSLGFNAVFIFSGVISLLGSLIFCFIKIDDEKSQVEATISVAGMFEIKAVSISLIILVLGFAYGGVLTFVALYAGALRLPNVVEYFFVVMAVASVIFRILTGRMYDRLGPNAAIYPAIILLAAGLLALGYLPTTAGMLTAAALVGIGHGMAVPGIQTLALQLSPGHRTTEVTATVFTCLDAGIGLGAYFLGGGIAAFGYPLVYKYLGVLCLSCTVFYFAIYTRNRAFLTEATVTEATA